MSEPSHNDIYRAIGRLEGKLDSLLAASDFRDGRYDKMDERTTKLETHKSVSHGLHVGVISIATFLGWPTVKIWLGL